MVARKGSGNGPPGNKNRVALKSPDIRQKAYTDFCNHIAKGKSIKSWWYEDENCSCTWETMLKYLKDTSEFEPIKRQIAEAKGLLYWENVVEASATGKNKDASTASLQMVMRNKYGWDKDESKNSNINYTIKVGENGIATGVSTERVPDSYNQGTE